MKEDLLCHLHYAFVEVVQPDSHHKLYRGKKTIVHTYIHTYLIIVHDCQTLVGWQSCHPTVKTVSFKRTDQVVDKPAGVVEPLVEEHCMPTKRREALCIYILNRTGRPLYSWSP